MSYHYSCSGSRILSFSLSLKASPLHEMLAIHPIKLRNYYHHQNEEKYTLFSTHSPLLKKKKKKVNVSLIVAWKTWKAISTLHPLNGNGVKIDLDT